MSKFGPGLFPTSESVYFFFTSDIYSQHSIPPWSRSQCTHTQNHNSSLPCWIPLLNLSRHNYDYSQEQDISSEDIKQPSRQTNHPMSSYSHSSRPTSKHYQHQFFGRQKYRYDNYQHLNILKMRQVVKGTCSQFWANVCFQIQFCMKFS